VSAPFQMSVGVCAHCDLPNLLVGPLYPRYSYYIMERERTKRRKWYARRRQWQLYPRYSYHAVDLHRIGAALNAMVPRPIR
jgi:hypothetical protein